MVPFSASIANTSGYAALFASGAPFPLPFYLLPLSSYLFPLAPYLLPLTSDRNQRPLASRKCPDRFQHPVDRPAIRIHCHRQQAAINQPVQNWQ